MRPRLDMCGKSSCSEVMTVDVWKMRISTVIFEDQKSVNYCGLSNDTLKFCADYIQWVDFNDYILWFY